MSNLDDIFDEENSEYLKDWTRVDIGAQCGICFEEADEVYVDRTKKKMKTVHHADDEHIMENEVDLSWLINFPN